MAGRGVAVPTGKANRIARARPYEAAAALTLSIISRAASVLDGGNTKTSAWRAAVCKAIPEQPASASGTDPPLNGFTAENAAFRRWNRPSWSIGLSLDHRRFR